MDNSHLYWIIGAGVIGLLYSFWKTGWINKQDEGTDKMKRIGADIAEGAMAFLKAEYRVLAIFVIVIAVLLGWANFGNEKSSVLISLSFVIGAFASGLAGFLGMRVATKANNRTTHAARKGLANALNVAFTGGSVMGLSVVALGVIGLSGLFLFYSNHFNNDGSCVSYISKLAQLLCRLSRYTMAYFVGLFIRNIYGSHGGMDCCSCSIIYITKK